MEPRREESAVPDSLPDQQKRKARFQIVKLEGRIAPKTGAGGHHHTGIRCRYSTPTSY